MRKVLALAIAVIALAAGAAGAQMMGGYQAPPPQQQPAQPPPGYGMYPGGMMGYGHPSMMGPGMMGYGGYPNMMGPGMMGYGYPNMTGPGMMGYGYPNMTGGGMMGYGGYPGMMGPGVMGYGGHGMMVPGMMGYGTTPCATYPGAAGCPEALGATAQKKFLDDTVEPRRKLHALMFDYMELARDPKADQAKGEALTRQIQDLQKTISEKWQAAVR